jgi:5'-3' exonuclease
MGVPAFFRWLTVRYPKTVINALSEDDLEYLYDEFENKDAAGNYLASQIFMFYLDPNEIDLQDGDLDGEIQKRIKENNPEFDNLYLDMNGIIHPCCHPQDKPQPKNEIEMMNNIFEYTDKVISIVKPQRCIYFAIDGVAPRAKMN